MSGLQDTDIHPQSQHHSEMRVRAFTVICHFRAHYVISAKWPVAGIDRQMKGNTPRALLPEHLRIIVFNFNCSCHESCGYREAKIKQRWSRMHIKSHVFPLNFKLRLWLIHEYRVISRLWSRTRTFEQEDFIKKILCCALKGIEKWYCIGALEYFPFSIKQLETLTFYSLLF